MDRLDELALFLAVLEAGSLSGAARRLRRSAPAVTRTLAALEARVGARLIERRGGWRCAAMQAWRRGPGVLGATGGDGARSWAPRGQIRLSAGGVQAAARGAPCGSWTCGVTADPAFNDATSTWSTRVGWRCPRAGRPARGAGGGQCGGSAGGP